MSTTLQILMAIFSVAGFAIAKLHTWMASPVGSDVMKVLAAAVEQQHAVQAHGKLMGLGRHGLSLFKDLAAVRHAVDQGQAAASGVGDGDAELKKLIAEATAAYQARKAAATSVA